MASHQLGLHIHSRVHFKRTLNISVFLESLLLGQKHRKKGKPRVDYPLPVS